MALKSLAEVNAQVILLKVCLDRLDDPKLETLGLMLAMLQEELIEMDLYGTYTPYP